jgi:predicted O-linked N-acetylglucosamine transferase (SPINDLY family)
VALQPALDALVLAGNRREDAGDLAGACELYRQAIRLDPSSPRGHLNLGIALEAMGDFDAAARAYDAVLAIDPRHPFGNYNYASLAIKRGDLARARALASTAVAAKPDLLPARIVLSHLLAESGELDAALAELDAALRLDPQYAGALFNRALLLERLGRYDDAAQAAQQAFRADPRNADAAVCAASLLRTQGFTVESLAWIREACRLAPGNLSFRSRELFASNFDERTDVEELFQAHRRFGEQLERAVPAIVEDARARDRSPGRRIRVGFVSGDLCIHPVALFLLPVLKFRDRAALEIVCYSSTVPADHMTATLRSLADCWVDASGLADDQLAERIRADRIDVLVDLAGHTGTPRLRVFAARPAPVQATWLGYLNTTGLSRIDWRLCDARSDPADSQRWHTEKLLHLPSQWCYRPFIDVPSRTEPPSAGQGHVTFGSFNQRGKITQAMCGRWARILAQLDRSRLVITDVPGAAKRQAILDCFAEAGVAADRIEFAPREDLARYFRLIERVDIALDTYPYGGGTTTFDALWMGVPVVTATGPLPASRSAADILSRIGMHDWIAPSIDRYVDTAVARATDVARIRQLRRTLRARLLASPLTNEAQFARDFEAALRQMWQAFCGANAAAAG